VGVSLSFVSQAVELTMVDTDNNVHFRLHHLQGQRRSKMQLARILRVSPYAVVYEKKRMFAPKGSLTKFQTSDAFILAVAL